MGWPYEFAGISHDDKVLRRQKLDLYACIAHYSALAPVLVLLAVRLVRRAVGRRRRPGLGSRSAATAFDEVPRSPIAKAHRAAPAARVATRCRQLQWWLGDDVRLAGLHWGQRQDWILGLAWSAWLLTLCVVGTGRDYFHLTKRFGAIALSQLPVQYLLASKALCVVSSHEECNRYHRILGRVIYFLLALHIIFYNYFFVVAGIWLKRFFAPIVLLGVVASLGMHSIAATSTVWVRRYSYRLFFITHLVCAVLIPVLVFFHAPSARLYLVEALVILLLDLVVRRVTTIIAPSTLEIVTGTNLVKVSSAIPLRKLAPFKAAPGSHVYLSIPCGSRTSSGPAIRLTVLDFLYNPFTVASVNEYEGTITIVSRTRDGPMTAVLNQLASSIPGPAVEARRIPLAIQGPFGSMGSRFHELLGWGAARVLLVAGGVGASFALPIYKAIRSEEPSANVQLIWAIRSAGDAAWAVSSGDSGKSVLDDEHIQLFLTGDMGLADDDDNDGDGNDAASDAVLMGALHRAANGRLVADRNRRRPDMERIVHDTFRQGLEEPVAVLVCGPAEMAREVRRCVRPWVMRGRRVWWHSESFGW